MTGARRLLLLAKAYPPEVGGIETYSEQVAMAYIRHGIEVTVVTAFRGPKGEASRSGIRVLNVGLGSQPVVFARMMRAVRKLTLVQDFDLIHATSWRVAILVLALRLQSWLIVSAHGREAFVVPFFLMPAMRRVFRRANTIVVVSRPILEALKSRLSFPLAHAVVGWNGLSHPSLASQHEPSADIRRLFCLCRLYERKNVVNAVRAVASLVHEGFDVTFEIAGSGPEAEAIDQAIAQANVGGAIRRLGRISDKEAITHYRECGIFLHPQIAASEGGDIEGFGISIADAMSFGAVVVAGASGGPLDFIEDGVNGLLVDGCNIENIVVALRSLLTNPERARAIAVAGRRFALENFTWDRHVRLAVALEGDEYSAMPNVRLNRPRMV
jgi:glycosyltransferase involved in cell wall biosynthesis